MSHLDSAREALRLHFGFDAFREGQDEVIAAVLSGEDALVVMPTGGGKSLCYQLPAMMRDGTTVVVSPLIALMKDQVDALDTREIPATFINSSLDFEEQTARLRALSRGGYKLVYVAPERFRNDRFVAALAEVTVSLFAVDEAHCISEWGHDFRPEYRRLSAAIQRLGRPQVIALTATATPDVRADIARQLGLGEAKHFIAGFDRPNLRLQVDHTSREAEKLRRTIDIAHEGAGIVYAATRKAVESVGSALRGRGLRVRPYHAGLDDRQRTLAQDEFMSGQLDAIVATNAFGMGIDKRDIRFVVHYHLPGSIEAYYQEIGRAGRDGLPATCALLFNYADTRFQQFFIEGSFPSPELISDVYRAVVALGPGRHELSARSLAAQFGLKNDMAVGSALAILERAGHLERGTANSLYATIEFVGELGAEVERGVAGRVLAALTTPRAPSPGTARRINLSAVAADAGLSAPQVRRGLEALHAGGRLIYRPTFGERGIALLDETPAAALRIDRGELGRRAAAEQRKLRQVIDYAYHQGCLRSFVLSYFGDRKGLRECGSCSGCVGTSVRGRRGAPRPRAADGTLRISAATPPTDVDTLILDSAPTGDALREHLRSTTRERAEQRRREVAADARDVTRGEAQLLDEAGTIVARKVLSCVARSRERFGKGVIAGVLRGSKSKKLEAAGLDKLSTYGILSEMRQDELVAWCDALIDAGLLGAETGPYPTLHLTDRGTAVMRGAERPRVDLHRFGLAAGGVYASDVPDASRGPAKESTVDVSFALFKAGMSIDSVAERRSLSPITVEGHLADLVTDGRIADVSAYVEQSVYERVRIAAVEHGLERLKPIHDALGGDVGYREIRLAVAHLRRLEP